MSGLVIPGTSTQSLHQAAHATTITGRAKLDSRLLAILTANDVPQAISDLIGDANVKTTGVFGHLAKNDAKFEAWAKKVLKLDTDVRPEDAVTLAQLTIVGEVCLKRSEVESEAAAHRAVNHLPPQLSVDDHASARAAHEKKTSRKLPDHEVPSESYFEKKCGEVETGLKAERLSEVTNLALERAQQRPRENASLAMEFDNRGTGTLRKQKTDFYVPMPRDEASLRSRFKVMGTNLEWMKLKFPSNPILDSASTSVLSDYVDYLCGARVWAFVVKDEEGRPISCPSLRMVCAYDLAMRELQAQLMKANVPYTQALSQAMADDDTRTLTFTTIFSMSAQLPECRALSAPGLSEIFANLPRHVAPPPPPHQSTKRPLDADAAQAQKSAKQQKLADKNKAKREKKAAKRAAAALPPPPPQLAILDIQRKPKGGKAGAKGGQKGGGAGKAPLPPGIKRQDGNGKMVCYAYNQGHRCNQTPCNMAHCCWWCLGTDHTGPNCPQKPA